MRPIEPDATTPLRTGGMPSTGRTRLGAYTLLKEIGQGGMADVYLARLRGMGGFERTFVVKAMQASLLRNRELAEMFRAEGALTAQLTHPNIVRVHDFGESDGVPYMVMDHVEGWNLEEVWRRQRELGRQLPIGAAAFIAREVCNALAYAHGFVDSDGSPRPVIHRDVSPSNVMLARDGSVRLLDFGIAKVKGGLARATGHVLKGKYSYLAPEQVTFAACDHRVDVWSLGVVLHELLTGERAFTGADDRETLDRIVAGTIEPPSRKNRAVKRGLDQLVLRALAHEPADRFETAVEMAEALNEFAVGSSYALAGQLRELFGAADAAPVAPVAAPASAVPRHTAGARAATMQLSPPSQASWPTAPPPAEPRWIPAADTAPHEWRPRSPEPLRRPSRAGVLLDLAVVAALAACSPGVRASAAGVVLRPQLVRAAAVAYASAARHLEALLGDEEELSPDMGVVPFAPEGEVLAAAPSIVPPPR